MEWVDQWVGQLSSAQLPRDQGSDNCCDPPSCLAYAVLASRMLDESPKENWGSPVMGPGEQGMY